MERQQTSSCDVKRDLARGTAAVPQREPIEYSSGVYDFAIALSSLGW